MNDITKCIGGTCHMRMDCWRFIAPSNIIQSLANFDTERDNDNCKYFMEVKNERRKLK